MERAGHAMDLNTVNQFQYDRRGRIEAGIKPAPPCTEPASYARLTRRGSRFLPECRHHGKNRWCIHVALLALHDLRRNQPKPKVKSAEMDVPRLTPQLGFRLEMDVNPDRARFGLRALSMQKLIHQPLEYLLNHPETIPTTPLFLEYLEDVAEPTEHGQAFEVSRLDLNGVLVRYFQRELFAPDGQPYAWVTADHDMPEVTLQSTREGIRWQIEPPQAWCENDLWFPGRPGFRVRGRTLIKSREVTPDFKVFQGRTMGQPLPWDAEDVRTLLREKHHVHWSAARPESIQQVDAFVLQLKPGVRGLTGNLGLFWRGQLVLMKSTQPGPQWLSCGRTRLLLELSSSQGHALQASMNRVRAPWDGTGFFIRPQHASAFLENTRFPPEWIILRDEADTWNGLKSLDASCVWESKTAPQYQVGNEWFSHDTLMQGLTEDGGRVRLSDGRLLRFDTGELQENEAIIRGAAALTMDSSQREERILLMRDPERGIKEAARRAPRISAALWQILRSYQRLGTRWLLAHHTLGTPALLADDMGLGKTVQALAFLATVSDRTPQLLIVPRSLLFNWQSECQRFTPQRRLTIHHGPGRDRDPEGLRRADLVLTTYGVVRADMDLLKLVPFPVVVLDEAQNIKNRDSQTSRAVCALEASHRVALTGTPVENRISELGSIFHFLAPGFLAPDPELRRINFPGSAGFRALRTKIRPFMLRRTKVEVEPDLPPRQEMVMRIPLEATQEKLYRAILNDARQHLEEELRQRKTLSVLTRLLRLRQVCCHPGLLDDALVNDASAKFEALLERLEVVVQRGQAALVFSQFTQLLGLLRLELESRDMDYLYLDGRTPHRGDVVRRFQQGQAPLFLISLKAGGTGLNLTRASYVFHLDPWWNPAVERQASDRAHRIGQTQPVVIYKLIAADTVEERLLDLQQQKTNLADGIWDLDRADLGPDALREILK